MPIPPILSNLCHQYTDHATKSAKRYKWKTWSLKEKHQFIQNCCTSMVQKQLWFKKFKWKIGMLRLNLCCICILTMPPKLLKGIREQLIACKKNINLCKLLQYYCWRRIHISQVKIKKFSKSILNNEKPEGKQIIHTASLNKRGNREQF